MRQRIAIWTSVCVLVTSPVFACLWDYDTLNMERARFPGALELITGKFARHSQEYYRWRVEDRTARIAANPDEVKLYDDLAVAYDKLGQHDEAIATILTKEAKQPGLYETYANLGTFHIHAGNLEQGIEFIDKAIEINPEAHFGREIYQRLLVQYVIARRDDGETVLPLDASGHDYQVRGFAKFVLEQQDRTPGSETERKQVQAEVKRATHGVMGMMRFGHHDSPILLECLADLLLADQSNDNKRLAARAFLQASYQANDDRAQQAYRAMAAEHLRMQTTTPRTTNELSLNSLANTFSAEQVDADNWYEDVKDAELRWIREGADVDAEFKQHYLSEQAKGEAPQVITTDSREMRRIVQSRQLGMALAAFVVLLMIPPLLLIFGGWYYFTRVRNRSQEGHVVSEAR